MILSEKSETFRDHALTEGAGEAIGILQLGELDGHALVVMAHDAAPRTAENDHRVDGRLYFARDRRAAQRDVDDAAGMHLAVRQDELRGGDAGDHALVLPR